VARVRANRALPGTRVSEAEALWYDLARWPSFVTGFGHVVRREDGWPAAGGRLVWDAARGERERVVERVVRHEARAGQVSEVEDARLRGTQTLSFAPAGDGTQITLELDYALKEASLAGAVADALHGRRALRAALAQTLERFARELAADRELLA